MLAQHYTIKVNNKKKNEINFSGPVLGGICDYGLLPATKYVWHFVYHFALHNCN